MKEGATYSFSCSCALIMFARSVLLFATFRPIIALIYIYIYIYIYILFPKSADCSIDGTMTNKLWIGKNLKKIFRVLSEVLKRYILEGRKKTVKFLRQNIRCPA